MKVFIVFPYLRNTAGSNFGDFVVKNTFDHMRGESEEIKSELARIYTFFSQREYRALSTFSYVVLDIDKKDLDAKLSKFKRSLEIYRFLVLKPDGRGLDYEHLVPYIIIPNERNPFVFDDNKEKAYGYDIYIDFSKHSTYHTFYTKLQKAPIFNSDIYSDDPSSIDIKTYDILLKKIGDEALRSLPWYNRTYMSHCNDGSENLLKVSTAFESLINPDRSKGRDIAWNQLKCELDSDSTLSPLSAKHERIVRKYLQEKLAYQLTASIREITGSDKIAIWFKSRLYPTGSSIRHGSGIDLYPKPQDPSKSNKANSLWYSGKASHDFLNNVYFAKRLFKFVFLELHYPDTDFAKKFEINLLEDMLVSDEERLKDLEKIILDTKEGELKWEAIRVCGELGNSYSGSKIRIYTLLQRLLKEMKVSFPEFWKEVEKEGEILLKPKSEEIDFEDYNGFNPLIHALIDLDSKFHGNRFDSSESDDFKFYEISNFVSFSVGRLI